LLTVAVLEALDLWETGSDGLSAELSLARDLLLRSERFALEDSIESRQLAAVAGHAAVESFLYAVLERPTLNI
jgi:hypothetical protein